jgi:hypothetical protein
MIGELCRDILREAHSVMPPLEDGPYYVLHYQGSFWLCPFGSGARWRKPYAVLPVFSRERAPFPLWVFEEAWWGLIPKPNAKPPA